MNQHHHRVEVHHQLIDKIQGQTFTRSVGSKSGPTRNLQEKPMRDKKTRPKQERMYEPLGSKEINLFIFMADEGKIPDYEF
jgi:hypothetical protein